MTQPVTIEFELLETIPEIKLIQLLIDVSEQFDSDLSQEEKDRAVDYFYKWYMQTRKAAS